MQNKPKVFDKNIIQLLKLCASTSKKYRFKHARKMLPSHWETPEGKVLWVRSNIKPDKDSLNFKVEIANPEKLLNDPLVRCGAKTLTHIVKNYKQQINYRHTKKIDKDHQRWIPSITNSIQEQELQFALELENFINEYKNNTENKKLTFNQKIKKFFLPKMVGIQNEKVTLITVKLFFPSSCVRLFIKKFNHMTERRTHLLNTILKKYKFPPVFCIPLAFKADCSPLFIKNKYKMLYLLEQQSIETIINDKFKNFIDNMSLTNNNILKLISSLSEIINLCNNIWLAESEDIRKQIVIHIFSLKFHKDLKNNSKLFEKIFKQIDTALFK